jgi:hypothetical protein
VISEKSLDLDRSLEEAARFRMKNWFYAGQSSPGQAQAVIDYNLDRLFPASRPALRRALVKVPATGLLRGPCLDGSVDRGNRQQPHSRQVAAWPAASRLKRAGSGHRPKGARAAPGSRPWMAR